MNRATVALLLAMLAWGTSVTTADAALTHLSPADLLLLEITTGTLAAAVVCRLAGRPVSGSWRPAFLLGSLEPGLTYLLANVGLALTAAAVGSMLLALESVFVVLIAWLALGHRPHRPETVAVLLGLAGAAMVATGESGGTSSALGAGLMVLAALSAATYAIVSRRVAGEQEPLGLVTRQGVATLVVISPFVLGSWLLDGSRIPSASMGTLGLAALTGLIGFTVPFIMWTVAVPHVSTSMAAVSLNLVPVFGVASAALFGRGVPSGGQLAGGALILVGLALITRAELRREAPAADGNEGPLEIRLESPVEPAWETVPRPPVAQLDRAVDF